MDENKFQIIVVGAGPAGCAAAYRLAKAGCEVLLVERGKTPGLKNVSGGRLYSYSMDALMPGEWHDAPLEREVVREAITFITAGSSISLDCKMSDLPPRLSYTVLRAKLDSWLATKAEDAGAMLITSTTVDSLLMRNGKVCGVKTGDEELEADLVICADGVNSLLASEAGLIPRPVAKNTAVAVKHVFKLNDEVINERFNLKENQGAGLLLLGSCTAGINGGGFLYTNKDSVSLGVVLDSGVLKKSRQPIADIAEDIKNHPSIAPLIDGGELIEYSAHLIPEGGIKTVPKLYADGLLVAGDAAGLVINNGFTVRGMDYAIMSGIAAAETAIQALEAGIYTASILQNYEKRLKFQVLRDMETFRHTHDFMVSTPELYTTYPEIVESIVKNIFTINGDKYQRLPNILKKSILGKVSVWKLLRDGAKGARSI
jgi:electron transfer flavoprotein-quinone oxidoreductase